MAMKKSIEERDVWDEGVERWEDEERRETIETREGENRGNGENKRPGDERETGKLKVKKIFKKWSVK